MDKKIILFGVVFLFCLSYVNANLCADCPAGMKYYWKADGTGDELIQNRSQDRMNANNGADFNTSIINGTDYGKAFQCSSGNDDSFNNTNKTTFDMGTGEFTIELWVYHQTAVGLNNYISDWTSSGDYGVRILTSNDNNYKPTGQIAGTYINAVGKVDTLSTWSHWALVRYANSSVEVLKNGTTIKIGSTASTVAETVYPLTLCQRPQDLTEYFIGKIDEVMIFSDARTTAEIKEDMKGYGLPAAADTTPPTATNCKVNNSAPKLNEAVQFNCTWSDNAVLSSWKFQLNTTGTNSTINYTWGANNESTFYYMVAEAYQTNVSGKFYANDSSSNWGMSSSVSYLVNQTPSPANWVNITLISPLNNSRYKVYDWELNYSFIPIASANITNCSLYINETGWSKKFTIYNITNGSINTIYSSDFYNLDCYQESANVSTACGGLNTGSYNLNLTDFINATYMIDGNWNTYAVDNNGDVAVWNYFNYSIPSLYSSAIWKMALMHPSAGGPTYYYATIPSSAFYGGTLQLALETYHTTLKQVNPYYKTSLGNWVRITSFYSDSDLWVIWEEAINWTNTNTLTGAFQWNIECSIKNSSNQSTSNPSNSNFTFIIDKTSPTMSLGSNNFFQNNGTTIGNISSYDKILNFSFADNIDLYGFEIFIHNRSRIIYNNTNTSLNGTSSVFFTNISLNGSQGVYYVNVTVWDSHTATSIENYAISKTSNKITFDKEISITAEGASSINEVKEYDRYSLDVSYSKIVPIKKFILESTGKLQLRDTKYKAHFVDWDSKKWIDFEGIEGEPIITKINDKKYSIEFTTDEKEITLNSIGGLNFNVYSYQYELYNNNPILSWVIPNDIYTLLENNTIIYSLNVSGQYLNKTEITIYKDNDIFTNDIISYQNNGSQIINGSYFNVTGSNKWKIKANHTNIFGQIGYSQLYYINKLMVDNCSDAANRTFRLKFRDESFPTRTLETRLELELVYWSVSPANFSQYNVLMENQSEYDFCAYPENFTAFMNLYAKYSYRDGFTERYYLFNRMINTTMINYTLYNHNTTTGISQLRLTTRKASSYSYFGNVLGVLQRYYPAEGVWRTVQMDLSGDYGSMYFNILETTTDYRLLYYDVRNHLLDYTNTIKFACTSGGCELTVLLNDYSEGVTYRQLNPQLVYNNNTKNLTLFFNDESQKTTEVRLTVRQDKPEGAVYLCNSTYAGFKGNITCDLSLYTGNVLAEIYSSASPETALYSVWIWLRELKLWFFVPNQKNETTFWFIGLYTVLVLASVSISPVLAVLMTIVSFIIAGLLGLLTLATTVVIIFICIMGVIVALVLRRQY